ncbi:microtubule associated protein-domain-containing protein [Spinellus fusiger]|nr:microtubule associated protein-domain-containing protein [Spinellus fusiger]
MSLKDFLPQLNLRIDKLTRLHHEMGTPDHHNNPPSQVLLTAILKFVDDYLASASAQHTRLREEANELQRSIHSYKHLMGEALAETEKTPATPPPLYATVQERLQELSIVKKHYEKRLVVVTELYDQIKGYSGSLDDYANMGMIMHENINVSLSAVTALEEEIRRCESEYTRRTHLVDHTVNTIFSLWTMLGISPQTEQECKLQQLHQFTHAKDKIPLYNQWINTKGMQFIHQIQYQLEQVKQEREFRQQEITQRLYQMWDRLHIEQETRHQFLTNSQGLTMKDMDMYEEELRRLTRLKEERVGDFIISTRQELACLWDQLYFSEGEQRQFGPAFSDEYNEATLMALEDEIARLQLLVENRKHILEKVEQHINMLQEMKDFENTTNDPSRLFGKGQRDPGRLLREEKFRKRVQRELPKLERELRGALIEFETTTKKEFLVYGEPYLKTLEQRHAVTDDAKQEDSEPKTPKRALDELCQRQPLTGPRVNSPLRTIFNTPQPKRAPPMAPLHRPLRRQLSHQNNSIEESPLHHARERNIKEQQEQRLVKRKRRSPPSDLPKIHLLVGSSSTDHGMEPAHKPHKRARHENSPTPRPLPTTAAGSMPTSDEFFSLHTGIFDDGPELSDMSDHDSP